MFWDRFYELCCSKNTKPNPVAKELGISSAVLTKWKNGISYPNGEFLIKIAKYFNVTTDYLLGLTGDNTVNMDGLTEKEIAHIKLLIADLLNR